VILRLPSIHIIIPRGSNLWVKHNMGHGCQDKGKLESCQNVHFWSSHKASTVEKWMKYFPGWESDKRDTTTQILRTYHKILLHYNFWGLTTGYCTTNSEAVPHRTLHKPLPLHYDNSMAACGWNQLPNNITEKFPDITKGWSSRYCISHDKHIIYPFLLWWTLHFIFYWSFLL